MIRFCKHLIANYFQAPALSEAEDVIFLIGLASCLIFSSWCLRAVVVWFVPFLCGQKQAGTYCRAYN